MKKQPQYSQNINKEILIIYSQIKRIMRLHLEVRMELHFKRKLARIKRKVREGLKIKLLKIIVWFRPQQIKK
jgi:hypothetical protein